VRIAVGGIYHESNTFFSQQMTIAGFREGHLHYGAEIAPHWRSTCSEMAGFLQGADCFGFDVVPTLMAWGMPGGAVTKDAFEILTAELIFRLRAAVHLDGVLLSLHGAMVAEHYADADAEVLRRVRSAIGPDVPLVVTIDFHANLTEDMVRWPDALIGYDTYPHIDQLERGLEAATVLNRMLRESLHPTMVLARRPLLPHILCQSTERSPMAEVIAATHASERKPGIVCISVTAGFPYADVPQAGFAVLAVGQEHESTRAAAEELADTVWNRRAEFACELPQAAQAVEEAIVQPHGLTVLVDVGDNLGAGTPGDGTVLLAELLRQQAQGALVLLCDSEAITACIDAGVGQRVVTRVGAKCDRHHGEPVEISGKVRLLSDGVYRNIGPMRDGIVEDQGRTAVVSVDGVLLVLTERRMPMWNLQQLRALGIEPRTLRIIVVKAAIAYRAAYGPIARHIIEVDTPGLAAADIRRFHYKRLERPIYPLDTL
jgi:microcystin degradation protein MlrC